MNDRRVLRREQSAPCPGHASLNAAFGVGHVAGGCDERGELPVRDLVGEHGEALHVQVQKRAFLRFAGVRGHDEIA